jgi:Tfp pilus assembly protein PilF
MTGATPLENAIMSKLAYILMKPGVVNDSSAEINQEELKTKTPDELIEDIQKFFEDGWELFDIHKPAFQWQTNILKDGGYHGACFVHRSRKLLVVSHRGTQNFDDLATDLSGIVLSGVCNQQQAAYTFCATVLQKAESERMSVSDSLRDFRLSFTGHSLGGWLGQCCCAMKKTEGLYAPAVVFDAPGAAIMLEQMIGTGVNLVNSAHDVADLPIEVYLSAPNLVNTCAASSTDANFTGVVWRIYPKRAPRNGRLGPLKDWLLHSNDQHCMTRMIQALRPSADENGAVLWRRRVVQWPKICWKEIADDAKSLASVIAGLIVANPVSTLKIVTDVISGLFCISGIKQDISSYRGSSASATRETPSGPDVSELDTNAMFDMKFRAHYETVEWDERRIIPMLYHPATRSRLERYYHPSNRAHRISIQGDKELMEWLDGGVFEAGPNQTFCTILMGGEGYTAAKARQLPAWFASKLLEDEQRPPQAQRVKWFDQTIPLQLQWSGRCEGKTKHNIPFVPDGNYIEHQDHTSSGDGLITRIRRSLQQPTPSERAEADRKAEGAGAASGGIVRCTALTQVAAAGLGGIGKTAAVVQLVHAEVAQETFDFILWASAESTATLQNDFKNIARVVLKLQGAEADAKHCRELVMSWLQHTAKKWLLVLDNADDLEPVREYMPTSAQPGCGHVVMTTRVSDEHLATKLGANFVTLTLEKLSVDEATRLLLTTSGHRGEDGDGAARMGEAERRALEELVEELDGLPLALVQAGALMRQRKCGFGKYLTQYMKVRTQVFDERGRGGATGKENQVCSIGRDSVATTWRLSTEELSPAARQLLQAAALLAADAIPREFVSAIARHVGGGNTSPLRQLWERFEGVEGEGEWKVDELLVELQRLSLISYTAERTFSMHRLLQQVQRDESKCVMAAEAREQLGLACAGAVGSFVRDPPPGRNGIRDRTVMAMNTRWLRQVAEMAKPGWRDEWVVGEGGTAVQEAHAMIRQMQTQLLSEEAVLRNERGDNDGAEAMYKRALEADPKHVNTLCDYALLLTTVRGKHDDAEAMYKRALAAEADPKHVHTLYCYARLLTDVQGEHDDAEAMYKRALEADPKHFNTLCNYANLLTNVRGKHDDAEAMYKRALEADPKHVNTLRNYAILLTDVRGDNDGALLLLSTATEASADFAESILAKLKLLTSKIERRRDHNARQSTCVCM